MRESVCVREREGEGGREDEREDERERERERGNWEEGFISYHYSFPLSPSLPLLPSLSLSLSLPLSLSPILSPLSLSLSLSFPASCNLVRMKSDVLFQNLPTPIPLLENVEVSLLFPFLSFPSFLSFSPVTHM